MSIGVQRDMADAFISAVDERKDAVVSLLQELVRIASVNPPGLEKECSHFVASKLRKLGFDVSLVEVVKDRPNVLGVRKGSGNGGKNLLFYGGHIDTVPPGELSAWDGDPFGGQIRDGYVYGRGAADHKSSIAASLGAIEAIVGLNLNLLGDLVYVAPVDEETGGHKGIEYLVEKGLLYGDLGILAGASALEEVVVASKGMLQLRIVVKGKGAHAAYPHTGVNPIEKASKLVLALQSLRFEKENPLFQNLRGLGGRPTGALSVTIIQAGVKVNVIPNTCTITVDRRLIPEETPAEALDQIQAVIQKLKNEDPEFDAEVLSVDESDMAAVISPDEEIVHIMANAARRVGVNTRVSGVHGSSDVRHIINRAHIPTIIYGGGAVGPGGRSVVHAPNECMSIETLIKETKIYGLAILDACKVKHA